LCLFPDKDTIFKSEEIFVENIKECISNQERTLWINKNHRSEFGGVDNNCVAEEPAIFFCRALGGTSRGGQPRKRHVKGTERRIKRLHASGFQRRFPKTFSKDGGSASGSDRERAIETIVSCFILLI
jgi:hypothetical protein